MITAAEARKMNRYGTPTTYKRITPERGCGFILERIWELTEDTTNTCPPSLPAGPHPTKQDVYRGTKWANRPGFASLLWGALIKDGLIEPNGGMQEYKYYKFYKRSSVGTRAAGHYEAGNGYTVRYHLTPKGRGVLIDMMERRVLQKAAKQAFCERNGIQFGTGKTLNAVGSVAEYDVKKDNERDILEKETARRAHLAADPINEKQKSQFELKQKLDAIIDSLMDLRDSIS